ncbi:MAG: gliding motility-associated C-terminal domain-containing protein, partial [Bacteroidetes bacterium]|nr:gliding motility-associated C-terminal domain-containing protein [Bacteroidota bacterium]
VPASWLNNPKLVYPLIIDPTATNTYASNQGVEDNVTQFSSTCQATMNVAMPAGTYSVTGTNTSYRIWSKGYIGSSLVAFVDIYADIKEQRSKVGSISGWTAVQSGPNIKNRYGSSAAYTAANNGNTYNLANQTIANGCYTNTLTIPFYWQGYQPLFPYTAATDVPAAQVTGCVTNYQELVTNTWSVTVTYVIGGTTPTFSIPSSICAGTALSLPATSSNGITGTWSPAANNTATTTYTFMPNAGQCALTTTVQVAVSPSLAITVNSATICNGGTATLTANGAATYTWSGGSTSNPFNVSPSSSTSYTVVGSNGGCTGSAVANVVVSSNPTITVNNPSICLGTTATLTANGAGTYTWSTSETTASISVSPTVSTSYTVTGANGTCTSTAVANISVNASPTITTNNPTICSGNTAAITVSGASTYTWNTGSTANPYNVSPSTTTSYTVIGANGTCTNSAVVTVSVNITPTVTVNDATICSGGTATLTASGGSTYTWSTSETTASISPSPTITSSYTVISANGICTSSAVATVNVSATSSLSLAANSYTICNGASQIFTASGASTYTWIPSSGLNNPNIATPSSSASTTTIYTVTGAASGCPPLTPLTLTLTVNPLPVITVNNPTICSGNTTTLTANGASTYTWSTGSSSNPYSVNPRTTTSYTVAGSDASGCMGVAIATVSVNPTPTVNVSGAAIDSVKCGQATGGVNSNHAITVSGGTPAYSYQWTNVSTGSVVSTAATLSGQLVGSYSLQVSDANGCIANIIGGSPIFSVPASSAIMAHFNANPTTGTTPLVVTFTNTSSGGGSYVWLFGDGANSTLSNGVSHTYNNVGTYTVTLIASNGFCADTARAVITASSGSTIIIPNVFTPNGDGINDDFFIENTGMTSLSCLIYNRWGELMHTISSPQQMWNGDAPGGGKAPDGTYMFILEAHGADGKTYSQQGYLLLLR